MINIDEFKRYIDFVSNKNGRGSTTPEEFNAAAKSGLYAWTNSQVSNQKQYSPGNPIPQTSFELDSISMANVRHLKEVRQIKVNDGVMSLPNGVNTDINSLVMPEMWMISKLAHKYASNGVLIQKGIKVLKDMLWESTLSSDIVMPTKKRAVANIQSNYMLIEPKQSVNLVTLSYVRNPFNPEWKYTVVNGRPVYDSVNSVDLDAPESAKNGIAMLVLELIGVKIRDGELVQAAASFENKGM